MQKYSSQQLMDIEHHYGAHNYHPLEVVIAKAEGIWVEDPEGKRYIDMLSAYSAVNQGHRHPAIIKALKDQADILTLTSRAFYNDRWPLFAQKAGRIDRQGDDPAHEHRRRSRGNGHQNHAQMGLPGQESGRRQGRDHRFQR